MYRCMRVAVMAAAMASASFALLDTFAGSTSAALLISYRKVVQWFLRHRKLICRANVATVQGKSYVLNSS